MPTRELGFLGGFPPRARLSGFPGSSLLCANMSDSPAAGSQSSKQRTITLKIFKFTCNSLARVTCPHDRSQHLWLLEQLPPFDCLQPRKGQCSRILTLRACTPAFLILLLVLDTIKTNVTDRPSAACRRHLLRVILVHIVGSPPNASLASQKDQGCCTSIACSMRKSNCDL